MTFEEALNKVLDLEGGLRLHKNPTENYITYAGIYYKEHPNWLGWQYILDQDKDQDIDHDKIFPLVKEFYKTNFWDQFNQLSDDLNPVHVLLFESSVNLGVSTTVKLVQKLFNITTDGVLGPITLSHLQSVKDNINNFIRDFTLTRIAFYVSLANKSPKKYSIYLRGWLNRTLKVLSWVS